MSALPPRATEERTSIYVGEGPILLKKSADAVDQIFSASWKRFPKGDAEGRTAER